MFALGDAQGYVVLLLSVAAFGLEVFAVVEAVRYRPDAYTAAGKRTKNFWLALTGVAVLLGFVSLGSLGGLGLLTLLPVAVAGVFLADVRPALRQVTGKGGSRNQGPYGPW